MSTSRSDRGLAVLRVVAGCLGSAVLLSIYVHAGPGWWLGFIALVPWLWTLDGTRTLRGVLAAAGLMGAAWVIAGFHWFGAAIDSYTNIGALPALGLLCALSPLLQPQLFAFAAARHLVGRRYGAHWQALAGASAWVACEAFVPKLLGDTLGHGLLPSPALRQVADLGGAAGLTFLLILVAEALLIVVRRVHKGPRAILPALAIAATVCASMLGYGWFRLSALESVLTEPTPTLRIGMVQASIIDYERQRREHGAYAVVRQVLDAHFALSREAVETHGADALLWSETVYPTPFGHPLSADGAALDREIVEFVNMLGVPLVFGTYDRDALGEYNAAAFLEPGAGLLGYYRKTHPFPLTEYVPGWLEGPTLRRWLPWAGTWQPGNGARVLPLRARDGREVNVLPLICADALRPKLAIDGARLGAQAIIGLSNDAWFTEHPIGARLHLTVAAFRSIETRLPQLRVTTNGLTSIIDPTGEILVSTAMGDRAVLVGEIPSWSPPPTLIVRWGDWVGRAALAFLLGFGALHWIRSWRQPDSEGADTDATAHDALARPSNRSAVLLTPWLRLVIGVLRAGSATGLVWIAGRMWLYEGLQVHSLAQLQAYAACVIAPALAARAITRHHGASASVAAGMLVLEQRRRRFEVPLREIAAVETWRVPVPGIGVHLRFASGRRWQHGIVPADLGAFVRMLSEAGVAATRGGRWSRWLIDLSTLRASTPPHWLDHGVVRFGLFPLIPALPAFRLHQHIAFGGTLGEYYSYGLAAWLGGLLIWWAAWSLGLMLFAAVLRIGIEALSMASALNSDALARAVRRVVVRLGRVVFYLGVPAWLLVRIAG